MPLPSGRPRSVSSTSGTAVRIAWRAEARSATAAKSSSSASDDTILQNRVRKAGSSSTTITVVMMPAPGKDYGL